MDIQDPLLKDGHVQIKLGPVEKWVLFLGLGALSYIGWGVVNGQKLQESTQAELKENIAEIKGDLKIVTIQTSDLATLRADIITLKLQYSTLEKQQQALEQNQRSLVRDR